MTEWNHPGSYEGNDDYELVEEFDASMPYEFDHYGVWREKSTGKLYWDHDSHCSCYGDYESQDQGNLELLDITSLDSFRSEITGWFGWTPSFGEKLMNVERLVRG